ncbi:SEC-C motif-containing protein [Keratinibaculum paraultunense]|uniref:SEC-C motif-containing protein n=1 Tax=Keratinibaculum paraultunense TaxID=1278232 RepID=A0A4R3KZ72_9FIRM|nr:SEC-C metal-binding domain-containing protein [Keratinibaculum paraultunense]QQY80055.1 SEC-C domain-containing protein [Keratinibaculum paraultunense]TCS91624.1 SEC-C motif-containing protein [Keratinibaculum paraultunense]
MSDNDFEDLILEIMESMEEGLIDFIKSKEKDLFKYVLEVPLTLDKAINTLTKNEMTSIRKKLNLKGLSTLNKDELSKRLVELMPKKIEVILNTFDKERYNLLKKIIMNNGYIKVTDTDIDVSKIYYLRSYGLIFSGLLNGEKILAMPIELMEVFKAYDTLEYRKIVNRNTLWIELVTGMLFYYGYMNVETMIEKIQEYTETECDILQFLLILNEAINYHGYIEKTQFGFKNILIIDENRIIEEQNLRANIPYYPFKKEELLDAAKEDFVYKTPQTAKFSQYIKSLYDIDDEEMDEILRLIYFIINKDFTFEDIIEEMQSIFEIDTIKELQTMGQMLMDINNNTRMWILKGFTPEEVSNYNANLESGNTNIIDIKTKKKISPNDPCPCGSGKKYKKCCGKK